MVFSFILRQPEVVVRPQVEEQEIVPVTQEVQHHEAVPQIDEEAAHVAVQLEVDEAWAQQVERMILERALAEDDVKTNSTKRAGRVTCGSTQDDTEESRHGSQVYTSIQILARHVRRFTPALCE